MLPAAVVDTIEASGLRGRGGAGFPTGRKWRTVAAAHAPTVASAVTVNAAEGEPGSFKDRSILRANPYRVLEGALIAAHAVGAETVVVALKRTFEREIARMRTAVDEARAEGWLATASGAVITVKVFEGPTEYLYGEETALLEAIDGRPPFPRIDPPYKRGIVDIAESDAPAVDADNKSAARVELAGTGQESVGVPALVDNVETLANVPEIIMQGADWFRSVGTDKSPGTIVCTVTGDVRRHGVREFTMGTPVREVIETIGGGPVNGRTIRAVMGGVSNPLLPAAALDTPLGYETMAAAGSGLGTAGFIVFDDTTDLVSVAAGVARFLGVESCGQCEPCKRDGLALADVLERMVCAERSDPETDFTVEITEHLKTVADGARCNLASQQQVVIGSVLQHFPEDLRSHAERFARVTSPELIAPLVDIVDGKAILDPHFLKKRPDWTDGTDSDFRDYAGQWPADRLADHVTEHRM